ncbi:MurR/RpiR family transcriptional regulator [Latilactobacillus curvatus]|nr:MurR/RpiR family transcriptional regulator [Latilactobacillus curvatus]
MMSIKGRILNVQHDLSAAENKIANYILENPQEVLNMTVSNLAAVSGSSPASVIRLSKRLNVNGFTSLKILLSSDLTKENDDNIGYSEITKDESIANIKDKLLNGAQTSISETIEQVDNTNVELLVSLIQKSNQLLLFGVGASTLTVENISQKWNRIGHTSISDNDLNLLLPKISNTELNNVLWIVSNSGESPEPILAARMAKKCGLKVVSLTKFGDNTLSRLSDIPLHTSQPSESNRRIAATTSLLAQFMVIDVVFYYFVSKTFNHSEKLLFESSNIVKEYKSSINRKN